MKLKTCWSENTFLSLGEHQEGGSQQDFWPDMGAEWKGKTVFVINDDGDGDLLTQSLKGKIQTFVSRMKFNFRTMKSPTLSRFLCHPRDQAHHNHPHLYPLSSPWCWSPLRWTWARWTSRRRCWWRATTTRSRERRRPPSSSKFVMMMKEIWFYWTIWKWLGFFKMVFGNFR